MYEVDSTVHIVRCDDPTPRMIEAAEKFCSARNKHSLSLDSGFGEGDHMPESRIAHFANQLCLLTRNGNYHVTVEVVGNRVYTTFRNSCKDENINFSRSPGDNGLPGLPYDSLRQAGINTWGELAAMTDQQIAETPGMRSRHVPDVIKALVVRDLREPADEAGDTEG